MTPPTGRERAVLTGLGAITPSGLNVADFWAHVRAGESAITRLDAPEYAALPVRIGGAVHGFDPARYLAHTLARRISPVQQWAIAAADEAMAQAGIPLRSSAATAPDAGAEEPAHVAHAPDWPDLPWPRERFAIIAATGSGPVDATQAATRALDRGGPRAVPFTLATYGAADAAAALLAARYGAWGAAQAICATCASGAMGLGTALRWIRHGYADAVLVVGMEDCLGAVNLASNARIQALAVGYEGHPEDACRPFDRARRGFVMSAGACAVLLESERAQHARHAAGLAELAGYGVASDAHHATAPPADGAGAARAMRACLADAGATAADVDHINTHGTGTPRGDAAEIAALQTVFGARGHQIPLAATKASTGHLLGAAGVAEAILAVQTLRTGWISPTRNLQDLAFPDWDIVAGEPRQAQVATVLSNSFGFGGHDAALLLRRLPQEPA